MDNYFDNKPNEQENFEQQYSDPNASYRTNDYTYDVNNMAYNADYRKSQMDDTPMSMGDWILTILALFIPCVGVIIYLIWAFSKKGNVNRRNYCRAFLIIYAVIMAIYLLVILIFGAAIAGSI